MKNRLLCLVVVVLMVTYFAMGSSENNTSHFNLENKEKIQTIQQQDSQVVLKDLSLNEYSTLKMEDYLIGVVSGEMPASFNMEALKAQAVAARSYAYNKIKTSQKDYDLTTDASTQVYLTLEKMQNKWGKDFDYYYNVIKEAVRSTEGEVITYNNEIISAYYFAMGNGTTEDSQVAFGQAEDYLVSVDSYDDIKDKKYTETKVFTYEEFCERLGINCDNGINIDKIIESATNRIITISINGENFSGKTFKYALDLRSNDAYVQVKDKVYITTCGWGHGVGMSQYGANNMANLGYNYQDILKHYYTGTEIKNVNSII